MSYAKYYGILCLIRLKIIGDWGFIEICVFPLLAKFTEISTVYVHFCFQFNKFKYTNKSSINVSMFKSICQTNI